MVERVNRRNNETQNEAIWEVAHFPEGGGVKRASIERAKDGRYFLRVGLYDKAKNLRETQILSLSRAELAELAFALLKEMVRG